MLQCVLGRICRSFHRQVSHESQLSCLGNCPKLSPQNAQSQTWTGIQEIRNHGVLRPFGSGLAPLKSVRSAQIPAEPSVFRSQQSFFPWRSPQIGWLKVHFGTAIHLKAPALAKKSGPKLSKKAVACPPGTRAIRKAGVFYNHQCIKCLWAKPAFLANGQFLTIPAYVVQNLGS